MQVEWSYRARTDRSEIVSFIAIDSVEAAIATGYRIVEAVDTLRDFPEIGRPGRVPGSRELVITGTPYVAAYRIRKKVVRILRIIHGKQRWPGRL